MAGQTMLYLVPYLISLLISSGIGVYTWRRRAVAGAGPYAVLALAQASWTLGYMLELASPSLEAKVFWDNLQFVGMFVAPMALLAFALEYTGRRLLHPRRTWGLLSTVPLVSLLLVFTDDLHGWIRPAAWLVPGEPFAALVYDYGIGVWLIWIYTLGLSLSGIAILVAEFVRAQRLYRIQIGTVVIGNLIPLAGAFLTLTGTAPAFHRDMTPFTFAIGNLVVAWGLFRYRLFDVVPVARDMVIENMGDVLIVLDAQDRVVGLNSAAKRAIGRTGSEIIGQPAIKVLSDWANLIEQYQDFEELHTELVLDAGRGQRTLELRLSPMRDRHQRLTGRLIVAHDITERKRAEQAVQQARDNLELLVQERTVELRAANERLQRQVEERKRAGEEIRRLKGFNERLVQSMVEVILVLDAEGIVTFANPATMALLGYAPEELVGRHWATVVPSDQHPIIESTGERRARGEEIGSYELALMGKDGRRVTVLVSASPQVYAETGRFAGTLVVFFDISERVQAEKQIRQRTDQLEALRQVSLEIATQLDLDTLLYSIVSRATELLGGTIGSFYLYRPDRHVLEVVVAIGVSPALVGLTLHRGEGLAGKVWQTGEPIVVEDYRQWEGRAALFDDQDFRATVGVPVRWGEGFLGVLDVVADAPGVFSTSDRELLSLIASQAAIAIQNARLFQAEHEQYQFAEAMREAAQVMGASLDVNEILRLILDLVKRVLVYDTASVLILGEENLPDLLVGVGYTDEQLTRGEAERLLQDSSILRQMARDLQLVVSTDVRQLDGWVWVPGAEQVRSWLGIPLVVHERMIGALMVDHSEPAFFGDRDVRIAQALARHAAQAIENARLYEAQQRQAMEAAAVSAMAQALNASTDLTGVFQVVAHHLARVVDFDRLGVAVLEAGKEQFTMYTLSAEAGAPPASGEPLPLATMAAAADVLAGRPHLTPDLSAELGFAAERTLYESGLRSRFELPLLLGETVVGALSLASCRPHAFFLDQLPLLTQVADAVAGAVQNARLYEETLRRNRELAMLNRVIAASAASQEIDTILETVCRELARAFDLHYTAAVQFDRNMAEAAVVAENRIEGHISLLGQTIPLESVPLARHLLQHKTPLVVENAATDPRLGPIGSLIPTDQAIQVLILPLLAEEELVGSLGVAAIGPRSFTPEEVDLAQRVTDQVSGALGRARLAEERRGLEEQFRQAQKMEALGRLAGGIAHDFNNLLTAIQLNTQLMQRRLHSEDPLQSHVQQIRETGERAARLIKQLLSFSRRDIVEFRLMTLDDVVSALSPMLRRIIGEDIELVLSLAEDLWPVKADPSQIEQVIVNLAVNARDAMPEGGTLIIETANVVVDEPHAAAHVDAQPGEHVLLAISDTGVGMDDEVRDHIFEPFFTTKEAGKGTGLGLATVFGIVTQSGGYIQVHSEVGQRTTFRIYLPRALETEALGSPRTLHPFTEELVHGTETVLVVEDEAAVRKQAVNVLEWCGYRVLVATDGAQALEVSRQQEGPIHLLLTDVVMPQISGVELVEHIRSQRPEIRVLYMSGYTPDAIANRGMLDEGVALLPKPFTLEGLCNMVRAVLDGRA